MDPRAALLLQNAEDRLRSLDITSTSISTTGGYGTSELDDDEVNDDEVKHVSKQHDDDGSDVGDPRPNPRILTMAREGPAPDGPPGPEGDLRDAPGLRLAKGSARRQKRRLLHELHVHKRHAQDAAAELERGRLAWSKERERLEARLAD
eukprot:UC4_evm2s412